ncbi:hypothetical protein ACC755_37920, partial [Rhizobium ruizarguesonis]
MAYLLQQLANSVPLAALYAALAFGYAVAFGVTKRADISTVLISWIWVSVTLNSPSIQKTTVSFRNGGSQI